MDFQYRPFSSQLLILMSPPWKGSLGTTTEPLSLVPANSLDRDLFLELLRHVYVHAVVVPYAFEPAVRSSETIPLLFYLSCSTLQSPPCLYFSQFISLFSSLQHNAVSLHAIQHSSARLPADCFTQTLRSPLTQIPGTRDPAILSLK